ncbi:MAG: OpgC domain-containing protein [Pseudolabrys sp.]|nr:OpgC domain-containing protein [Pseudolabrys sp.]
MANPSPPATRTSQRDLRLDLFRGIALWLIFLDHIPYNIVSWITLHNYGFSDATEIFVFISGYTAAFVYGREMKARGTIVAFARILRRAWQIYVAHIFLFAIFMAEITYVMSNFENPLYREEMQISNFLDNPVQTLPQALLLKFQPEFMDILPLYFALLVWFAPFLWLLIRLPLVALATSVMIYCSALYFGWNFHTYPDGTWYFNPLAWQLLFCFGAWCALGGAEKLRGVIRSPVTLWLAIAYLIFAFAVVMTWTFPAYSVYIPKFLSDWMYPVDKTNLDVLRFVHFLALAALTVHFLPKEWPGLKSAWFKPAIICGQNSLEIFCLGVFLSCAARFFLVEISSRYAAQVLASAVGVAVMVATAALIQWYKRLEERKSGSRPSPNADLAGGEA